jgi:signal transduction histidine kinase
MSLADAVSVGLLECRGGRVVWANAALARIARVAGPQALHGRGADALLADVGHGLPDWVWGEAARGPAEHDLECALACDAAPRRLVRVRALGAGVWEIEDVTELRALAQENHRLGAELLAAHREIGELQARADEDAKERDELLSVVSHELQTPLTVVAGFTRLLLAEQVGPLNDEQRHFLTESARSCQRLSRFLRSLVEASGDVAASGALAPVEHALGPVIESVVELLRPLALERGQRMAVAHDAVADRARFDPTRVEQVLLNLLGNALKYGRPGGRVEVSTRRFRAGSRGFVEVAVVDDGPGVPEPDRERIFEPYVRGHAEADGAGLGLGLAICRRIVEAHGGRIGVSDAPGGGACFAFTLPACEAA